MQMREINLLTEAQFGNILFSFSYGSHSEKKSAAKIICIMFFEIQRSVLTHMIPRYTMVSGEYYATLL